MYNIQSKNGGVKIHHFLCYFRRTWKFVNCNIKKRYIIIGLQGGGKMEVYNKRIIKLLHLLSESKKALSSEQLALSVGVTSRTVRSDLKELQSMLKTNGATIEAEAGCGYRLLVRNEDAFHAFLANVDQEQTTQLTQNNVVPSDPKDRSMFIIQQLLIKTLENSSASIDPEDLADELFISMSTLRKDLKSINQILQPFDLKMLLSTTRGVHIQGNEDKLRYCISEFIFNRNHLTDFEETDFYEDIFPSEDTKIIREILLEVMTKYSFRLTDIAFKNLATHIVIMLKRFFDDQRVIYDDSSIDRLEAMEEFRIAKEITTLVKNRLHADLGDEIYYLTQHLIASKKFLNTDFHTNGDDFECKQDIHKILKTIQVDTGIDLLDDAQLMNGLAIHLNVALHRLRFHMNIRNEFLECIKNDYPFAFELAVKASEIIEQQFSIKTNENEIGFLAVHFGAALERKGLNEKNKTLSAVIVCASGMATAMLLKEKIRQHFQNRIHIKKICPLYEINQQVIDDVDLVLTTVPMEEYASEKIIRINILLEQKDIVEMEGILNRKKTKKVILNTIFRKELYLPHLACKNKQEVLEAITSHMVHLSYMSEGAKQSVFKREAMATTELGSMVAMPHAMENDKEDACVAVAILDKAIVWDQEKVQVVLLLNIAKCAYGMWEDVFKSLYHYLISDYGVQKLMKGSSYEEFIRDLEYQN